jgi:hypothetical protein
VSVNALLADKSVRMGMCQKPFHQIDYHRLTTLLINDLKFTLCYSVSSVVSFPLFCFGYLINYCMLSLLKSFLASPVTFISGRILSAAASLITPFFASRSAINR